MTAAEDLSKLYGFDVPARISEGITHRQLARILKSASKEAGDTIARLASKPTFSSRVRRAQLQMVMRELGPLSTELWSQTGKMTEAGVHGMARIAADQALDLDFFTGMPADAVSQYAPLLFVDAERIAEDLISRKTDGYTLAEKIYANGKVSTRQVGHIVDRALAQQLSARELATQVRGFYSPNVPGGVSYAAQRLARTEINNAHHYTSMRLAADKPWVTGFKWNLSGSHKKPDECDENAHHDEGLGEGVFRKNNEPARPHPQCLCYVTHEMESNEVFMARLNGGQYDNWMTERGVVC